MQQERRGYAAGQGAVDCLILIIEGVFHHHVGRDRAGGLVDVVIERDVRVTIDDAWGQVFASGIDDDCARGRIHGFADRGDLAVLDIDGAILDVAVGHGHHGGVLDDNVVVGGGRGLPERGCRDERRQADAMKRKCPYRHQSHVLNSRKSSLAENFGL